MTSAIFEILGLLLVSALIGVVFSWLYWRSKNSEMAEEVSQNQTSRKEAESHAREQTEENEKLRKKLEKLESKSEKKEDKNKNSDERDELIDELKEMIAAQDREIDVLSSELEKKKVSYYKQIKGKRYKASTLKIAEKAVEGKGDGRISKKDAEKIFENIADGNTYTQVEKETVHYIRDNYTWTEGADELFRKKVRTWAAKDHKLD